MKEQDLSRIQHGVRRAEDEDAAETPVSAEQQLDRQLARVMAERFGTTGALAEAPSSAAKSARAGRSPARRFYPALAAALSLLVILGIYGQSHWQTELDALPRYELAVIGVALVMRSTAAQPAEAQLSRDSILELVLRPKRHVQGRVEARALLQQGTKLVPWPVVFEKTAQGTFRLRGRVGDLPMLALGRSEIVVVLARPEKLPSAAELLAALSPGGYANTADWQILRQAVELKPN